MAQTSELGITSTYVENTERQSAEGNQPQDHLHIRGEYNVGFSDLGSLKGSPPHTWRILLFNI